MRASWIFDIELCNDGDCGKRGKANKSGGKTPPLSPSSKYACRDRGCVESDN
jgi:hypothetical protein